MGLVKIKHPDIAVLGEVLEENLWLYEPRGWTRYDEHAEPPAASARKSAWVDFAVSQGATEDDAEYQTRAQLIEQYGTIPDLAVVDPSNVPDTTDDDEENDR